MSSLEKQQVVSFLKILQIPTDLSPDEIKSSLLEAGWNESDANEAVTVLHPQQAANAQGSLSDDKASSSNQVTVAGNSTSQIVAQKYVQSRPTLTTAQSPVIQKEAQYTPPPQPAQEEAQRIAQTIINEQAAKAQAIDASAERPHSDAPWLEHQVDIYDVTPEEREKMIRTVYRTNERLSPQTIHALLGIDVDLSEFEHNFKERNVSAGLSWKQITLIIFLSVCVAALGFVIGMYTFEVGPFHPSLTN